MVLSMNPIKKESTKPPLPLPKSPAIPLRELAIQEQNQPTDSQIRLKRRKKKTCGRRPPSPVAGKNLIIFPDEVGAGDKEEISSESSKRITARTEALVLQRMKGGFEKKLLNEARGLYKMLQDTPATAAEPVSMSSQLSQSNNSAMSNPQAKTGRPIDQLPNTPGNYSLTLKFTGFEVRVKSNLKSEWALMVCHSAFMVCERRRNLLIAKPEMTGDRNKSKFSFEEGREAQWEFMIPGTENHDTPLEVRFFDKCNLGEPIAFAKIQLGNSFVKLGPFGRKLHGFVGIYAMKPSMEKTVKIGDLDYDFTIGQGTKRAANIMLASPSVSSAAPLCMIDDGRVEDPFIDSDGWKSQEEQQLFRQKVELQEKERACFLKAIREKTHELETMKKQHTDKLKEMDAKEERRKLLEAQRTQENKAKVYDLTKARDELKYLCSMLEHDKKLLVEDLGKRLDDTSNVAKVAQSRIRALETKLELKDAKIAELILVKNKSHEQEELRKIDLLKQQVEGLGKRLDDALNLAEVSQSRIRELKTMLETKDAKTAELTSEKSSLEMSLKSLEQEAARKIDLREQKIKQLGKNLTEALHEKEHYLAQSKQLAQAEEMQALLRAENEELKLQMQSARQQEKLGATPCVWLVLAFFMWLSLLW